MTRFWSMTWAVGVFSFRFHYGRVLNVYRDRASQFFMFQSDSDLPIMIKNEMLIIELIRTPFGMKLRWNASGSDLI